MLPSAERQTSIAIPALDRYGKKGHGGKMVLLGGREDCSRYPAPGRGGAVFPDGRGQDLLSSQLFAFPHSAAPTSSALPQHPFVEGCTITR